MRALSIPAYILPPPTAIFTALYRGIVSTLYIEHIWITLTETLLGFVVGTALAFALGTVVALEPPDRVLPLPVHRHVPGDAEGRAGAA